MEEKRGKTGENRGKTGKNGEKRGKTGEKRGKIGGEMGEDGNCDECSGLLHCHYFLFAYPCLCCSHLHTDMSNFHPHEGILYVHTREGTGQPRGPPKRFPRGKPETGQHIIKQHEATGGAVHLLACTAASVGDVRVDDFLFAMCVSPVFPRFPRFPPFSPVFPRFSLLPGTKRRLGTGTLDPCSTSLGQTTLQGETVAGRTLGTLEIGGGCSPPPRTETCGVLPPPPPPPSHRVGWA